MARRVILIVLGVLLLLIGAGAAVAGGALMAVFGSDNTASSGQQHIVTRQIALVAPIDDINHTKGFATVVGQPTLRVQVHGSDHDVFVGIGPAAAVEHYLAGTPIARVTDLNVDPFRITTRARPGTSTPASAPSGQNFWTVSDAGTDPSITWKITNGSYRLVIMNADTAPGIAVGASAALTIPHLFGIGIGTLVGGVIVALAGVVLIVLGARSSRTRTQIPNQPPNPMPAPERPTTTGA